MQLNNGWRRWTLLLMLAAGVSLFGMKEAFTLAEEASFQYAEPRTPILGHQYINPLNITVEEWQTKAPAFFPALPVHSGPSEVSTGPLHVTFSPEGLPVTLQFDRWRRGSFGPETRLISNLEFDLALGSGDARQRILVPKADESGYELNNSYFTRRLARFSDDLTNETRLDVYTEMLSNSLFFYLFPRLYLKSGEAAALRTTFQLDGEYRRVTYFLGNERVQTDVSEPITFRLDETTTKPFLLFEKRAGAGIAFFLPLRPEVRAWYHEHYLTTAVPSVEVTIEPVSGGLSVTLLAEGLEATSDRPHTFDLYYWAFPFQGAAAYALNLFPGGIGNLVWSPLAPFTDPAVPGFWIQHWPNTPETRIYQALRYFPSEGYSFGRPLNYYGGAYMTNQEDAHVWGIQSGNFKRLNFTNTIAEAGFVRDLSLRHLQLYLDKADETGIPPYRTMAATWFKYFEGMSNYELLNNFHFAQAPEFMVKTAANFIASGQPAEEDQQAIAAVFNRMLEHLDPNSESLLPNTFVMQDGSYWYNYFEIETQRIREGLMDEPGFVNNVHVTWLNIMADAALLNKRLGNEAEYLLWREYLLKGVDGMIYLFSQDRAWAEHDPNEIRYGISWPGPNADYAHHLLSGWLPRVMEFTYEEADGYRLAEQVALFRRIMQGRWAQQGKHASARSAADVWLNTYLYPRDTVAPMTTLIVNGDHVADDCHAVRAEGVATVVFEAVDDLSGVERIEYAIDEGAWMVYRAAFSLPLQGKTRIAYRALDFAGNVEAERSVVLIAD